MNLARRERDELEGLLDPSIKSKRQKNQPRKQKVIYTNDGRAIMTQLLVPGHDEKRLASSDILTSVNSKDTFGVARASSVDNLQSQSAALRENSVSAGAQFELPSPALQGVSTGSTTSMRDKEVQIIPRMHIQDSTPYGTDVKEGSQQSIKRMTPKSGMLFSIGSIFLWFNSYNAVVSNSNNNTHNVHSTQSMLYAIGVIFGWLCTGIYVSSRIPQLKLMLSTKKVEGLNPLFFCLTMLGNLTQCASMLVMPGTYTKMSVFVTMLPWLISSGVCMLQDSSILFLIFLYKNKKDLTQLTTNNYGSFQQVDIVGER